VHLGALLPLLLLLVDWANDDLTANPIQAVTLRTGYPALVLLVLSLACTPVAALTGWKRLLAFRRPLGLYAVLYASLHLAIFALVDYGLDWSLIGQAIGEKRYIVAGFAAFVLLLPLALTSTQGWQRRLGRRWKSLHRVVYLAVPLAALHYLWLSKSPWPGPGLIALAVVVLLVLRWSPVRRFLAEWRTRQGRQRRARAASSSDPPMA
jgi:sulfoxide reductase heme-binding subunit YedZ